MENINRSLLSDKPMHADRPLAYQIGGCWSSKTKQAKINRDIFTKTQMHIKTAYSQAWSIHSGTLHCQISLRIHRNLVSSLLQGLCFCINAARNHTLYLNSPTTLGCNLHGYSSLCWLKSGLSLYPFQIHCSHTQTELASPTVWRCWKLRKAVPDWLLHHHRWPHRCCQIPGT